MWAGTFTTLPEGDLCPHSFADNIPKFPHAASGKVYLGTVRLFFPPSNSAAPAMDQEDSTHAVRILSSDVSLLVRYWLPSTSAWAYTQSCARKCSRSAHIHTQAGLGPIPNLS